MTGQGGEIPRILDVKGENPSERITFGRLVLFLQVYENLSLICSMGIFMLKSYIVTYLQICTSTSSASALHHPVCSWTQKRGVLSTSQPPALWQVVEVEPFRKQSQQMFCFVLFLKKVLQKREPRWFLKQSVPN